MTEKHELVKQQPKTLKEYIEVKRPEITSMLPSHVNVERFLKSALLAVARDPQLQTCTPLSLFTAVINAAELGLDFTPTRGHAYLIKYGASAVMMPGYRGMIDLAKRTGDVARIEAHLVYEKDKFELQYGTDSRLIHVPLLTGERGRLVGVYGVAFFKDGGKQFEFMTTQQVDAIRTRSKAARSGPWVTDYEEMARKTVVRRLFKYLPSSSDLLDKALEADNRAIGLPEIEIDPMEDGEKTSRLAERLSAQDTADATYQDVPTQPETTPAQETRDEPEPAPATGKPVSADPVKEIVGMLQNKETTIPKLKAAAQRAGVMFTVPQSLNAAEAQKILDNLE